MQVALEIRPVEAVECAAAVLPAFEDGPGQLPAPAAELYESKEFSGKPNETALLYAVPGFAARRVLLYGAGKREKLTPADLRRYAGAAARTLQAKSLAQGALLLDGELAGAAWVQAAVEGALAGHYDADALKTERNNGRKLESFTLAVPSGDEALRAALERGRITGEAQNFARDLVNEPANRLPPAELAARAEKMAAECGLECEVLDVHRLRQLGMGALLGVAQGSAEPPVLIVLRYRPEGAAAGAHLGLVGKGVTFDSGGLSIKPADGMEKMKYDMAGGAAVIGAMRGIADLRPAIPVTALIPAVENMTGPAAQRPGDIVTSLSGKTIEVLNTDAEGRLILADAMTYAARLGCTHLVDAATLTGAIVVALGHLRVGLFSNDDELRQKVLSASEAAGERMWHMPLDDDYKDYLKSAFADIPNIGGRWGGAVTAAMFLREFANPLPWVHLDIAGTAWLDDGKPHLAKGASGVPVRTFIELAMAW
ncbi:MAG: leucyl aminopeptidase [Bryobacterales bacterium]|nr:leucyl aminopeptidase [Bryobacterales bacterium]